MRDNIEMMLHFKRVERPAAGVYGGLCVAPYHFKHFDELLADIGATGRAAMRWWRNSPRPMRTPMAVPGLGAGLPGGLGEGSRGGEVVRLSRRRDLRARP